MKDMFRSLTYGCIYVAIISGILTIPSTASAAVKATVGAYYFDGWWWYGGNNDQHVAYSASNLPGQHPEMLYWTGRKPTLEVNGPFRTDSQAVMNQEIDLAADHGVSFFNFNWYWINTVGETESEDTLNGALHRFRNASNNNRMKFGVTLSILPTSAADWTSTTGILTEILQDPHYQRVDGKPLVTVFDHGNFSQQRYNDLQNAYYQATGISNGLSFASCNSDVEVPYSMAEYKTRYSTVVTDARADDHEYPELTEFVEGNYNTDVTRLESGTNQKYIPTVMAGWDPRAWNIDNYYFNVDRTAQEFGNHLQESVNWLDNNPTKTTSENVLMLYAWNEYGEGGYIAPTQDDQNGAYLDAMKSVIIAPKTWDGSSNGNWATSSNWDDNAVPGNDRNIVFDSNSTGNLATTDNISGLAGNVHVLESITVADPSGNISIAKGAANQVQAIEIGTRGIDMYHATQDLTITAPMYLGPMAGDDYQGWYVADGRTLSTRQVHGYRHGVTPTWPSIAPIKKFGEGKLVLGNDASGEGDNDWLTVQVSQGVVELNKDSSSSVHAAATITRIDAGATVKYTGSGDYQVNQTGYINLDGGTLDFYGNNQNGTDLYISSDSTLANTASSTTSIYAPLSTSISSDFTVNTVGDLYLNAAFWPSTTRTITKTGGGKLVITNTQDNNIKLLASEGTVELNHSGTGDMLSGILGIATDATVKYTGGYSSGGRSQVWWAPSAPITLTGGTLDLNGRDQTGTTFTVDTAGSTLANTAAGTTSIYSPSSAVINQDFTIDAIGDLQLTGGLSGTSNRVLTKTGGGTLTLGGTTDNAYLGLAVNTNSGKVKLNKSSTSSVHAVGGAGITALASGSTVQYTGTGNYQLSEYSAIILTGGTLDFNGKSQTGTTLTVSTAGSTLANTAASTTSTYSPSSTAINQALTVNAVGDLVFSGTKTGSGSLTKTGGGLLTLEGTNSYSGGTYINGGNLEFDSSFPQSSNIYINSGGALLASGPYSSPQGWLNSWWVNDSSAGAIALTENSSENINMARYASLSLGAAGNYTYSGTLTPYGGAYNLGGGGGTLTVQNNLTGSQKLVVNGNVTLNGANNNYTGGTEINAGNLKFASSFPQSSNILINSGGTLVATGPYSTPKGWIDSWWIDTDSSGTIALTSYNAESISMSRYPDLFLGASTACTYNGAITPNGGTYRFGGGEGTLTVQSTLDSTNDVIVRGNVTFNNTKTYSGSTTIDAGELRLSSGTLSNTSGITLNAGGTLLQNSSTALNRTIDFDGGTFGGTGVYNGSLNVEDGHLSPGDENIDDGYGYGIDTLTVAGNLILGANSILDYDFGVSSGISDLLQFSGASRSLTLDGTINISCIGTLLAGNYTIFSGASSIIDNGLLFGDVSSGHVYSYAINGGDVIITAAPEPGTLLLLAIMGLSLIGYAWRKRR